MKTKGTEPAEPSGAGGPEAPRRCRHTGRFCPLETAASPGISGRAGPVEAGGGKWRLPAAQIAP
jgi:hypothetical protein